MSDAASMVVGTSAVMEETRSLVRQAALNMEPVLLVGEIGTGKHLAARTIHSLSARSGAPFVRLNCGSLTETLFEGALFGRQRQGFTASAHRREPGSVHAADGGTLFLDEVCNLSPASQVKVLRLMEEQEYCCVGGTERLKANVRMIAATYRSLPELVKAGTFHEDLCHRLGAVQIVLPPLRERPGDFEVLVPHFLSSLGPTHGHQNASVTPGAIALLAARRWFGNVRDLENFIELMLAKAPPGDAVIGEAAVESRRAAPRSRNSD